ncbi:MAG: response regulator [Cyanobacteria bacterium J06614_10]
MLPEQQQRIMGYFIEEAKDHLNTIEQGLLNLQTTIEDAEKANEVFRAAHSVKGGAAMLGLESIQKTAHRMEDYFKVLKESPVQVDRTLETMFLRVSDGLKDLLEQLEGPFGLTQEKAQEIMADVDPVFGQLEQHLSGLVAQAGGTFGEPAHAQGADTDAIQTSFKRDVPNLLRQMLAAFKQPDNDDTRNRIQSLCTQFFEIGEQFSLSEWCDLVKTARLASANRVNEYKTLAPVLIKEIKKAQDLVLSGRASEVAVSDPLQQLLPDDILATSEDVKIADLDLGFSEAALLEDVLSIDAPVAEDSGDLERGLFESEASETVEAAEEFDSLFDISDLSHEEADDAQRGVSPEAGFESALNDVSAGADAPLSDADEPDETPARLSVDLDFNEIPSELSTLNRDAESAEKADESLDALLATVNVTGPDVGAEELNSLADLFDGDLEELDNTLGGHPFVSEEMRLHPEKIDLDEEDDLTDLLGSEIGSDSLEEAPADSNDFEDDLFGGTLTDTGFANPDELDALDEAFGDGFEAEDAQGDADGLDPMANSSAPEAASSATASLGTTSDEMASLTEDIWGADETDEDLFGLDPDALLEAAEAAVPESDLSGMAGASSTAELAVDDDVSLDVPNIEPLDLDDLDLPVSDLSVSDLSDSELTESELVDSELSMSDGSEPDVGIDLAEVNFSEDDLSAAEQASALISDEPALSVSLTEPPPPAVSLFSDSYVSPSEDEIEFPTLTGKKLKEAEQSIDSFFDDAEADAQVDSFSTEESSVLDLLADEPDESPEAAGQLADDPWGELSIDAASTAQDASDDAETLEDVLTVEEEKEETNAPEDVLSGSSDLFADLSEAEEPPSLDIDSSETDSLESLSQEETMPTSENEPDSELWDDLSEPLSVESETSEVAELELSFDDLSSDASLVDSETSVPEGENSEDFLSLDAEETSEPESDRDPLELSLGLDNFALGDDISESDEDEGTRFAENFIDFDAVVVDEAITTFSGLVVEPSETDGARDDEDSSAELFAPEEAGLGDDLEGVEAEHELDDPASGTDDSTDGELADLFSETSDVVDHSAESLEDFQPSLEVAEAENAEEVPEAVDFAGIPSETISETADDDFGDLESLLADSTDTSVEGAVENPTVPSSSEAGDIETSAAENDDEDFGDLERLLDEGEGIAPSETTTVRRAAPRVARRSGGVREQNMRVPVKHLDNLSNLVGELVVSRNTLERDQERLRQFLDNLLFQVQQLNDVGQRMRDLYERSLLESSLVSNRRAYAATNSDKSDAAPDGHATGATFDALEMDRFTGFHTLSQEMIELIVRVRESSSDIGYTVESSDQVTRQFRQITTQLQEGLNTARMVAFSQAADRLPRAVRDISLKCGKEARLVVEGKDTLIDKMIVEHLYDPLTHLVNNAITHGIETPEERKSAGKSPEGVITVQAFYQGNQTVIYVADDGGGINPDFVKRKAIEKKLITQAEADALSDIEAYELIFHAGFSTRDEADDFAGRGVGMDVVRTSLAEIRGAITIDSELGKGTGFTIRLPLTLSISKALSCVSNQARIAFPMDGVEDMLDVPRDRIVKNDKGHDCVRWREILLPFQTVTDLLKFNRTLGRGRVYGGSQDDDVLSIIVLRSANTYVALQVDQVIGEEEIVIKQLEGPVPKPLGIAGATILGDGRVMPIADVLELIDIAMGRVRREPASLLWAETAEAQAEETAVKSDPTVLIVDDSITVRELLSMSFNKVGYRVEQARDGQEAWDKLRSGLPCDLVFCDIEMPRMDGLELLSRMQKDNHLKHVPIAMLTSRGADRHRQMAVDLGASGYFTKPYLEEALLDAAQRMLNGETLAKGRGG